MASVNRITLLGNVGKDPEFKRLQSGMAVCSLSLATTSRRKDKNTGEMIEDTQWHRVQFFDRLAEIVEQYVKKGSPIYVEGRMKYGTYEKDGHNFYTADVIASEMQLLGSKQDGLRQQEAPRNAYADARGAKQPAPKGEPNRNDSGFNDINDDIPF